MPPKADNPTGFWESLTVAQLHDDLFAHLGRRWDHPPVLDDGWENDASFDGFVERMRGVVDSHFAASDIAVWKDPRGSFFLPLWRRAVPIAGTILCVRWPDDVARSLARREGLDSEFVAAMWLRYVVAAYHDNAGAPIIRFDDPYEDAEGVLKLLAGFIGARSPSEALLEEFRAFVQPGLRHHSQSQGEPTPGRLLQLARAMYALITREPREVVLPFVEQTSDGWRMERYSDDQAGEVRAYRDLLGPSVVDVLRDIDLSREPA